MTMERSFYLLLIVVSFGVRIQGDTTIFLTTFWCDLKCRNKLGGCLGYEGSCKGVCYCIGVSFLRYKNIKQGLSITQMHILMINSEC